MLGDDKIIWWLMGIFGALLAGGGSQVLGHGERIAKIENSSTTNERHLTRIEKKLDRLIERQ